MKRISVISMSKPKIMSFLPYTKDCMMQYVSDKVDRVSE